MAKRRTISGPRSTSMKIVPTTPTISTAGISTSGRADRRAARSSRRTQSQAKPSATPMLAVGAGTAGSWATSHEVDQRIEHDRPPRHGIQVNKHRQPTVNCRSMVVSALIRLGYGAQHRIRVAGSRSPTSRKASTRGFDINWPNSCSLKHDRRDLIIRKMLADFGIEPREPAKR